ncbi:MAG: hypothetical protein ACFB6R_05040 [Alphaproteobacteria bacterium]
MSFRSVSRFFILGAVVFLVCAGALSLYATGYIAQLQARTMAPDSGTGLRAGYVAELDRVLGPRGAGGALREYALTRTPRLLEATARYLATARQAIGLYTERTETLAQQQGAAELATVYEKVSSLHANAEDLDPTILTGRLEATNAQLTALVGALGRAEIQQQFNGARKLADLTQGTVIFSFVGAFVVLMIGAILIRIRVGDPLQQAVREMEDMAVVTESGQDADTKPWGLDRRDEIGKLTRAVQRMREAGRTAGLRPGLLSADGPLQIQLAGPSGAVMDEMLEALREAARDLTERGRGLEATREEAAQKAADEVARLTGCVGELSSSQRKIEELVSAQRKDLGTARKDLVETTSSVRDAGEQMQARFEDTLAALRTQTDGFAVSSKGLADTAQEASGRLADMVSGLAQTKDAVSGVLTDVRSTADTARSAADALKDRFATALDDIRTASTRLNEGIGTVRDETARLRPLLDGQYAKMEEVYGAFSGRLIAAADAIDATVAKLSSVQDAQDAKLEGTQSDLRRFGETVAVGISQISRSLEQGNARIEGLGHDLTLIRTGLEDSRKTASQDGADTALLESLTAAAEAHKTDLDRFGQGLEGIEESLKEVMARMETADKGANAEDQKQALSGMAELGERVDALAKGLADGLADLSDRITVLPGLEDKLDTLVARESGPGDLAALQDQMGTLLMGLSGLSDSLGQIGDLEKKLDAAIMERGMQTEAGPTPEAGAATHVGETVSDLRTALDGFAGKIDDLAGALGEGLNEILGQVSRTGEDYGVTAAAVSRQQTELRGAIDEVATRLDTLTAGFASSDGAAGAVSPEGLAAVKEGLARIEAQSKTFAETLDEQLSRLEAGTSGLTQAMGAGLTQTDQLAERIGVLETRAAGLSETVLETFGRIDTRLAAVSAALEAPGEGEQSPIPIDDLRQCIEETLLPFVETAQGETAQGEATDPEAAVLLQDVVAKLGTLTDRVDHTDTDPASVADAVTGLGEALGDLRRDLLARLDGMVSDVADLKGRDGTGRSLDAEALAALAERVGAEARSAMTSFAQSTASSDGTETGAGLEATEPVVRSLAEFARLMKEQGMIDPDEDSLPNAAADIDAVTDVIDVLERRSALLARRIMEGTGSAGAGADMDGLDPESAISRLQAASEKLGNIATAVAIASDAQRLHAAG